MTLSHQCKHWNTVPPEAPYIDVYTKTFILFLRSLCKIIWMNVHNFPNAPCIKRNYSIVPNDYYLGSRKLQTLWTRFRLGCRSYNINAYLFRNHVSDSDKCRCGLPEATDHFIHSCILPALQWWHQWRDLQLSAEFIHQNRIFY